MLANIDKPDNLLTNCVVFNDFNKNFILFHTIFSLLLLKIS
jgi:hypothetical protein